MKHKLFTPGARENPQLNVAKQVKITCVLFLYFKSLNVLYLYRKRLDICKFQRNILI